MCIAVFTRSPFSQILSLPYLYLPSFAPSVRPNSLPNTSNWVSWLRDFLRAGVGCSLFTWRISSHPQARAGKSWYTKHPVAWPSGEVTPRCFLRFLYGIQLWSLTVTWQLIFYQLSFLSSRPYPCSLHLPNKDILESALRFTPGIIQTLNTLLWNLCLLHTSVILKRKG